MTYFTKSYYHKIKLTTSPVLSKTLVVSISRPSNSLSGSFGFGGTPRSRTPKVFREINCLGRFSTGLRDSNHIVRN